MALVVHVDNGTKKATSLADLLCHVCRTSGVTSINVVEHDLQQMTKAGRCEFHCSLQRGQDSEALTFRYTVRPKSKVSCFEPGPPSGDAMAMRGTVLGGLARENLSKLPCSNMARTLWEALCNHLTAISLRG